MSKIEVKNLVKIFGSRPERGLPLLRQGLSKEEIMSQSRLCVGLSGVNLTIEPREFLVIVGLSGSGKSTLVRCLNRLIQPTAGEVRVDDVNLCSLSRKELRTIRRLKFGMVFQRFALFPHRTVRENVEFGLEIQGIDPQERQEKALSALSLVNLERWKDYYPKQLSAGMQQRVGLARSIAPGPDILLMDEPFSALDPLNKKKLQEELLNLQQQMHKTIIFITHDLDEAVALGDRLVIMKEGHIVQQGTPEEIRKNPSNDYVREFTEGIDTNADS